jgi:uncharacterized cupin superfamily protein
MKPPFVVSTADVPGRHWSDEPLAFIRSLCRASGLSRVGFHVMHVSPGHATAPHCHEDEEEMCYVLDGRVDAWIDGTLTRWRPATSRRGRRGPASRTASSTTPTATRS